MWKMRRVVVLDRLDAFKHEICPDEVEQLKVVEEINGTHTLTIITTSLHLTVGDKVLVPRSQAAYESSAAGAKIKCDMNCWVVYGIKSKHTRSGVVKTEYTCIWSVQYDAMGVYVDATVGVTQFEKSVNKLPSEWWAATLKDGYVEPGITNSNNPSWELYLPINAAGSASFYNMDGWEAVKRFLERWGGELDSWVRKYFPVDVDDRYFVSPADHLGSEEPVMRLEYGWDVKNVERTVQDGVLGCRVIPLGKSTQTEGGGYTRRPTIAEVNSGIPWLSAPTATVNSVRRKKTPPASNQSGTYYWYPTVFVKNDTYEKPADLKAWAEAHLDELMEPKVTYKMDALMLGDMGLDSSKLHLGDTVTVVDREMEGSYSETHAYGWWEPIPMTDNAYVRTNQSNNTVISLDPTPAEPTEEKHYRCAVVPVQPNDSFIISAVGASYPRAVAWVGPDRKLLTKTAANDERIDYEWQAGDPTNVGYLVINDVSLTQYTSYKWTTANRTLTNSGMRLTTRATRLEYSLLGENQPTKLTLGTASASITSAMQRTNNEVAVIREQMDLQQTSS